jgi:chromate transporter
MFSFAAYLGAEVDAGLPAAAAAAIALLAVFLPGFLLLLAVLPVWSRLLQRRWALGVVAGINAAVVGLLAAALYDPVWTQGVRGPVDFAIAVIGFALLAGARVSALWVVLWCVLARWLAAMAGF